MTKQDLINEISESTGVDKFDVSSVMEASFILIKNHMAKGENIYIRGFGGFKVKKRREKKARNITAGTTHIVPEHFTPTFQPANVFKDKVRLATQKIKESSF